MKKDNLIILVTGSSGFVGETLIPKLQSLGHQIIGIDHSDGQYTTKNIDISKPFTIEQKIDAVIHLAAKLVHHRSSYNEVMRFLFMFQPTLFMVAQKAQ